MNDPTWTYWKKPFLNTGPSDVTVTISTLRNFKEASQSLTVHHLIPSAFLG